MCCSAYNTVHARQQELDMARARRLAAAMALAQRQETVEERQARQLEEQDAPTAQLPIETRTGPGLYTAHSEITGIVPYD